MATDLETSLFNGLLIPEREQLFPRGERPNFSVWVVVISVLPSGRERKSRAKFCHRRTLKDAEKMARTFGYQAEVIRGSQRYGDTMLKIAGPVLKVKRYKAYPEPSIWDALNNNPGFGGEEKENKADGNEV